jgi:hypothetical protein
MKTTFHLHLRVGLCAAFLLLGQAVAPAAPRITCDSPTYDFGVIHSNTQRLPHVFILKNTGDTPLHIAAIKSSCGCTTAQLERKDIEPGGHIALSTAFDPSGRSGAQHKTITILTNDPAAPELTLELKCDIQLALKVEPPSLFFGQVTRDAIQQRTARIEAAAGFAFSILGVDTTRLSMASARLDTVETGRVYAIVSTMSLGNIVSNGFIREQLTVTTDMPGFSTIVIPVVALVADDVSVKPSSIVVNMRSLRVEPLQRELYIQSIKDRGWTITAVEAHGDFKVATDAIEANHAKVSITGLQPESSLPAKQLRVRVRASDGDQRILTVPFRYYDSTTPRTP